MDMRCAHARRKFLERAAGTLGCAAATSLWSGELPAGSARAAEPLRAVGPHFPGKAKHVIYLHMVGGPSQIDLYDYKPKMDAWYDKDLPDSVRQGQRLTTMTSGQTRFPIAPSNVQVRPARPVRHVGQRAAAVHGQDGRTNCASSAA